MRSPDDVARVVRGHLADRAQEVLLVVLVDSDDRLLGVVEVAVGDIDEVSVDSRLVLGAALVAAADRFWLVHNHPRASPMPSPADRETTTDIRAAAPLVGLTFLGHLVVGESGSYRLARGFRWRPLDAPATSGSLR